MAAEEESHVVELMCVMAGATTQEKRAKVASAAKAMRHAAHLYHTAPHAIAKQEAESRLYMAGLALNDALKP